MNRRAVISLKSAREIQIMREAGRLVAQCHATVIKPMARAGVSFLDIDRAVEDFIVSHRGFPTFKGYKGYPAATCICVNEYVVHGIPDGRRLKDGDILSVDLAITLDGYIGDSVWTYPVGEISPLKKRLLEANEKALYAGIEQAKPGNFIGDIGYAMNAMTESYGFKVNPHYGGHGVGKQMHEDAPSVPNFGRKRDGVRLRAGMTVAIEPILHTGGTDTKVLSDQWTVVSTDGSLSSQFEHTVAITANGPQILTVL